MRAGGLRCGWKEGIAGHRITSTQIWQPVGLVSYIIDNEHGSRRLADA